MMIRKVFVLFLIGAAVSGCASNASYEGNAESYELGKRNIIYLDLTRPAGENNVPLHGDLEDLKMTGSSS